MQILFNELSLASQFSDHDEFVARGLIPLIEVLREMQRFSSVVLLKKSDVWGHKVTRDDTLHSLLVNDTLRMYDEVRRLKSAIADLTKEPFWDIDSKQDPCSTYFMNDIDICESSPAEACERDRIVVSLISSEASANPLIVLRNGIEVSLDNLTSSGMLTEILWSNNKISFEVYLKSRFDGRKLDFTTSTTGLDFSIVQPDEQSLFINTFRKFEDLSWSQIYSDQGLYYKEYNGTIDQRFSGKKTYKFRISQKFRCHGYRENDSFVVINFETNHKLSDKG